MERGTSNVMLITCFGHVSTHLQELEDCVNILKELTGNEKTYFRIDTRRTHVIFFKLLQSGGPCYVDAINMVY